MNFHRKAASQNISNLNDTIEKKFIENKDNNDVRKTHLFEGRYENIYLTEKHIPELSLLIDEANTLAKSILKQNNIRTGYWFNFMPPKSSTIIHSHDDYDELLSAVYYVVVPNNSGNLIIHDSKNNKSTNMIELKPKAGEFIFFKPDIKHEVTQNNSADHRLSIGINFGSNKDN